MINRKHCTSIASSPISLMQSCATLDIYIGWRRCLRTSICLGVSAGLLCVMHDTAGVLRATHASYSKYVSWLPRSLFRVRYNTPKNEATPERRAIPNVCAKSSP